MRESLQIARCEEVFSGAWRFAFVLTIGQGRGADGTAVSLEDSLLSGVNIVELKRGCDCHHHSEREQKRNSFPGGERLGEMGCADC